MAGTVEPQQHENNPVQLPVTFHWTFAPLSARVALLGLENQGPVELSWYPEKKEFKTTKLLGVGNYRLTFQVNDGLWSCHDDLSLSSSEKQQDNLRVEVFEPDGHINLRELALEQPREEKEEALQARECPLPSKLGFPEMCDILSSTICRKAGMTSEVIQLIKDLYHRRHSIQVKMTFNVTITLHDGKGEEERSFYSLWKQLRGTLTLRRAPPGGLNLVLEANGYRILDSNGAQEGQELDWQTSQAFIITLLRLQITLADPRANEGADTDVLILMKVRC